MNFIIWLVVGGVIGWIASLIMRTDGQQGIFLNIVVGIVGAFIGGLLIGPLLGSGSINTSGLSLASVLVSLGGAVILLAIINLFRRGRAR
ncbi:MAG: GlsB/YeaQ/YmgE family stress response membrane protein [Pseudomonadota bacterium]